MSIFGLIRKIYFRYQLWRLRRAGLVVADDCRLTAPIANFGSEPYLITIGNHVAIAGGVSFITHDGGTHVFRSLERYKKVVKYGRITILDNCVIGQQAIILPGVTIGPNSVVAAGAVVTRNVPPGVLVAGNPAKTVMTTHQYAEWSLAATPDYDVEEYQKDKKALLLKLQIRGVSSDKPPRQEKGVADDAIPE